jgi:hypothetical protein
MATSNTEVAKQAGAGGSLQRAEQSRVAIRPAVDIYEDGDGITLQADLPGVSQGAAEHACGKPEPHHRRPDAVRSA